MTLLVVQDRVAALANEDRERHAPGALAREHPVGLARHHALDAVLAGRRNPADLRDRLERDLAQRHAGARIGEGPVHGEKPLRRVAEDDRLLRTPAVRILVLEPPAGENGARLDQRLDHRLVRIALLAFLGYDAQTLEARRLLGEGAVLIDRVGDALIDAALGKKAALTVQSSKSSRPWLGAVWTKPVPASSVTCSPSSSGTTKP